MPSRCSITELLPLPNVVRLLLWARYRNCKTSMLRNMHQLSICFFLFLFLLLFFYFFYFWLVYLKDYLLLCSAVHRIRSSEHCSMSILSLQYAEVRQVATRVVYFSIAASHLWNVLTFHLGVRPKHFLLTEGFHNNLVLNLFWRYVLENELCNTRPN